MKLTILHENHNECGLIFDQMILYPLDLNNKYDSSHIIHYCMSY